MARLIGVAAAVHVGEVEAADGAQRRGWAMKRADGGGAADLGDEDVLAVRQMEWLTSSGRSAQRSSRS